MMSRSTGLALIAIGAVLVLAVHVPLTFMSLRFTGLVLMITGLTGLRIPQRACRWLYDHQNEVKGALGWFTEPSQESSPDGPRVPLDDLLRPEHTTGTPAGHRG